MGKTIKVDVQGIDEIDLILEAASTSADAAESVSTSANTAESLSTRQSDIPDPVTHQAGPEISSVAAASTGVIHGTNPVCPAIIPLQLSTGSTTLSASAASTTIASHKGTHLLPTDYSMGPTMNFPTVTQGITGNRFNWSCGNITDGNSTRPNGTGVQTNCVAPISANVSYAYAGTAGAELTPSPSAVPNLAQGNGWDFLLWTIVLLITVLYWV